MVWPAPYFSRIWACWTIGCLSTPKTCRTGDTRATPNDIVANVPYIPGCGYWFDHHSSEDERLGRGIEFQGASKKEKSAARVIWDYFGGHDKFGTVFDEMLAYVDRVDSGELTAEEIQNPTGWILLGFIMDPRTGLGRYRHYTISNYALMEDLIEYCQNMPIDEILDIPDVKERVDLYFERQEKFAEMLQNRIEIHGNVILLDLREQDEIYPGNRFTMYAMHPECNISIQVIWGLKQQNTVFSVGHSILNRTSPVDVGSLMLRYGGGGHQKVGTCQVPNDKADELLAEIIDFMVEH